MRIFNYFRTSRLNKDTWYSLVDQAKDSADDLHDALRGLIIHQPLRYLGLEFEFSDDYQMYRIKDYGTELLYKFSTEEEIIKGIKLAQSLNVEKKVYFCKKCHTIRISGRICLSCKSFVTNIISTNELNLNDYASSREQPN